nr:unnamed protein product [Callosobruchus analis]
MPPNSAASLLNGAGGPPGAAGLLSPAGAGDPHQLIYAPFEYANYAALAATPLITDYAAAAAADHSGAAAAVAKQRRTLGQFREHPYQRAGALS